MNYMNIYSPPTKLREDSGLSVSHSVGVGGGGRAGGPHATITNDALDVAVQDPPPPNGTDW